MTAKTIACLVSAPLQRQRSPIRYICEISEHRDFRVFVTIGRKALVRTQAERLGEFDYVYGARFGTLSSTVSA
jgi:hypothetical protein